MARPSTAGDGVDARHRAVRRGDRQRDVLLGTEAVSPEARSRSACGCLSGGWLPALPSAGAAAATRGRLLATIFRMRRLRWVIGIAVVFGAIWLFVGGEEEEMRGQVSADSVTYDWPLTVEQGTLRCEANSAVIFQSPEGTKYALNGTATARADQRGYADVDEIWRDNPDVPGLKVDIGGLISDGLELCD